MFFCIVLPNDHLTFSHISDTLLGLREPSIFISCANSLLFKAVLSRPFSKSRHRRPKILQNTLCVSFSS